MRGNKGKNAIPVNQYNKDWEFMKRYPSIKDAAAETGIKAGSICAACKGKYHSAGGYHWVYYHEVKHMDESFVWEEKGILRRI